MRNLLVAGILVVTLVCAPMSGAAARGLTAPGGAAGAGAGKAATAQEVLARAEAQAVAEHKNIFLIFGASWCADCHVLDSFLELDDMRPTFDKYYVFAKMNVLESHGGDAAQETPNGLKFMNQFGGISANGTLSLPFVVILDDKGKLVVNSIMNAGKTKGLSAGMPEKPEEVAWFVGMLRKSSPAMTDDEANAVRDRLLRH